MYSRPFSPVFAILEALLGYPTTPLPANVITALLNGVIPSVIQVVVLRNRADPEVLLLNDRGWYLPRTALFASDEPGDPFGSGDPLVRLEQEYQISLGEIRYVSARVESTMSAGLKAMFMYWTEVTTSQTGRFFRVDQLPETVRHTKNGQIAEATDRFHDPLKN